MRALHLTPALEHGAAIQPGSQRLEARILRGAHYTDYVEQVKTLRRGGLDQQAEELLFELIDATEEEARAEGTGVAPWYYEQLAILYSKRKQKDEEIAVLERFAAQPHAPGVAPPKLLQRLAKKKAARD